MLSLSVPKGIFQEDINMAKVMLVYQSGVMTSISNYGPILNLSVFSKMLRIVCNSSNTEGTLTNSSSSY